MPTPPAPIRVAIISSARRGEISWETEVWVWVQEASTHLIHFDGERFLGPYES